MQHYSPASVDGAESASHARRVSDAYSGAYNRIKHSINTGIESLQLPPPDRPMDDLWSGGPIDDAFRRADAGFLISRQATGLTRAQRAGLDNKDAAMFEHAPRGARFLECTKSRFSGR
jgi:hypothetical protein